MSEQREQKRQSVELNVELPCGVATRMIAKRNLLKAYRNVDMH